MVAHRLKIITQTPRVNSRANKFKMIVIMKKFQKTVLYPTLFTAILALAPNVWAQSWDSLSADTQNTLRPLRLSWPTLSDTQKQSWLKRVPELKAMPADQLATAQERMAEWTALSDQQRAQVQERLRNSRQPDPSTRAKLWRSFTGQ